MAERRGSITANVLDALEQEAREQKALEEKKASHLWLILPTSNFLNVWLAIIGPLIVYNVVWVPLEVSQMAKADKLHAQVDFVLDFFFYIDMIINLRTAFIDKENNMCLDGKKIAKRYLSNHFFVDLVATVQWEIIITQRVSAFQDEDTSGGGSLAVFAILRLPRLLRLLRLFKKLDVFPQLKVAKLMFLFLLSAHWVGCLWFVVGYLAIQQSRGEYDEAISSTGSLNDISQYSNFPIADKGTFGDSWLLRHFGPKSCGQVTCEGYPDVPGTISIAELALRENKTITEIVRFDQLYFTSLYWAFTMLMKSPHVGPDTWIEKLFSCLMVLLGLFVTTQLVAVVTQMVLSFDKANSTFRDRQQEYARFSTSRSLPPVLRRKLLTYSLHEWSVNLGYDPLDVIKEKRLPHALTNQMVAAMYDDVIGASPLLRIIEKPVLHETLKYIKVVVSLQKEILINQADPCTRLYILRQGSLQASASDRLLASVGKDAAGDQSHKQKTNARSSTWKLKMQVRMIERPGDLICCRSPYEPPQPLPFQVMSLKRTTLCAIHMQDLHAILSIVSETQTKAICECMAHEHQQVLNSVKPKTASKSGESMRKSEIEPEVVEEAPPPPVFSDKDLAEDRLDSLESDVALVISQMAKLHEEAKLIPRMVEALCKKQKRHMIPMPPGAEDALKRTSKPPAPLTTTSNTTDVTGLIKPVTTPELDALNSEVKEAIEQ